VSRHRDFPTDPPPPTPEPLHTDRCLRDYARYHFCEHTRLNPEVTREARRRRARTRDLLAWASITLLVVTFVLLFNKIGWWAFLAELLLGTAWLGVFLFGLPSALTADIRTTLPPDTKERLR
jgi:hypothetical protein